MGVNSCLLCLLYLVNLSHGWQCGGVEVADQSLCLCGNETITKQSSTRNKCCGPDTCTIVENGSAVCPSGDKCTAVYTSPCGDLSPISSLTEPS